MNKEELRKEFIELWEGRPPIDPEKTWPDNIFDFFWKHLEQRETESYENGYQDAKDGLFVSDLQAKIQSLEQILKAADEVIDEVRLAQMPLSQAAAVVKLLYKYDSKKETATTLKQQMK